MFTYMNTPSVFFQMGVYESHTWPSTPTHTYQLLHSLLDRVDSLSPGKLHYQGTFRDDKGFAKYIPEDLLTKPPFELTTAARIGTELLKHPDATGIVFGTQITYLSLDYLISMVTLLAWKRGNRKDYIVRDLNTGGAVKLKNFLKNPQEHSIILYVRQDSDETEGPYLPNIEDISSIDEDSEYPSPGSGYQPSPGDGGGWWRPSTINEDMDENDDPPDQVPPPQPPAPPPQDPLHPPPE